MKKTIMIFFSVLSFFGGYCFAAENESTNNLSIFTGTFDVIDKEGDDQTY